MGGAINMEDIKDTKSRGVVSSIQSFGSPHTTIFKNNWITATTYIESQQVLHNNDLFICSVSHTANELNEPGVGTNWGDVWLRQADSLSTPQLAALVGTGTPATNNKFVTEDTLIAHDHDGTDAVKVPWVNVSKTSSSIADIATRSHTALSSIGTNTHTQIDSHVADVTKHRQINDSGTSATELWSANKTNTSIAAAMFGVLDYQEEPVIDKDLSTPPSPVEGARYIVKATGADAWTGESNNIVQYITDAWVSTPAVAGMVVWVTDEDLLYLFTGNTWLPVNDFVLSQTNPEDVDYDAVSPGVGTTVAKGDHSHSLKAHDHVHSEIQLDASVGYTYTLEDFLHLESAGRISGGDLSDDGESGVDITELHCLLKTSELDVTHVMYVVIPAGNIPRASLTDNYLNYICADYNDGTPQFFTTTSRASILTNTQIILGRAYLEDGELDIFTGGINVFNVAREHHDRLVMRGFERMSGAVLSETGTRYLKLTSGVFYFGSNRINIGAKDTSDGDTYTRYLRDGHGGWVRVDGLTQTSNNVYDDNSGTPAAIPTGKYAARWVYVCLDGDLYVCDGQNHFTLSEAKVVQQPTSLPDYVLKNTKLVAKYIISPDEDHFVLIVSGYENALFGTTSPTNHQGMAGLQGGQVDEYYHLTNTQHTALTTNLTETVQDIAGSMVDGTDTGMTLTYSDETGKIVGEVTYGTISDTACEGNDARLSNARTPSSHTIASHTTSGASDGKVLTASSATEFGWENPAPTWEQVSGKPTTFAPISHTIASHTTSDAALGKLLTASSTTEFGWADPAPTWTQVSGKPTTFAPIVGVGAADACAGNDTRLSDARASTWATVSGKPTTFAPIIGTGATDAVAGNDSKLTDTRTPKLHGFLDLLIHDMPTMTIGHVLKATGIKTVGFSALTTVDVADSTDKRYVTDAQRTVISNTLGSNTGDQTLPTLSSLGAVASSTTVAGHALTSNITLAQSDLTDYTSPVAWVPTVIWSGLAPTDTVTVARYIKVGKLVTFWLSLTGADGDGRKITSVTLPVTPADVGMKIACTAQTAAPTTRSDPYAYIVADTATVINRLLLFYTALTFANNTAYSLVVTGSYEVA